VFQAKRREGTGSYKSVSITELKIIFIRIYSSSFTVISSGQSGFVLKYCRCEGYHNLRSWHGSWTSQVKIIFLFVINTVAIVVMNIVVPSIIVIIIIIIIIIIGTIQEYKSL
jgi:hypothetical protein